jgi:hypothetical protein
MSRNGESSAAAAPGSPGSLAGVAVRRPGTAVRWPGLRLAGLLLAWAWAKAQVHARGLATTAERTARSILTPGTRRPFRPRPFGVEVPSTHTTDGRARGQWGFCDEGGR